MNLSPMQQKVVESAKSQLSGEPWFRGVCIDSLPRDREIERDGIEEHASQLVIETAMWDDPEFLR